MASEGLILLLLASEGSNLLPLAGLLHDEGSDAGISPCISDLSCCMRSCGWLCS